MRLRNHVILWLLLLAVGGLKAAAPAAAQPAQPALVPIERSEDDLLLMALVIGGTTLSEEFETYTSKQGILVPLGELCRLLEIGITVNPQAGTATGFVVREQRTFQLDLRRGEVQLVGKPAPFDAARIELHRQDIYVDSELLSQWLPLTLRIDRPTSVIVVQAREPLPVQMRLERNRRSQQLPGYQQVIDRGYPRLPNPYRMFSRPSIDQTLTMGNLNTSGGDGFTVLSSTYMAGDLLGMSAEFYGYLDSSGGAAQPRLSLRRADPDGHLLGAMGAREIELGDVFSPSLPLLTNVTSGRGFVISRFPLYQQQQYDLETFRGRALPGWDVELYREGVLLGYANVSSDGQYEFPNIPLYFGLNRFLLVFYGPRGEKRTEERVFYVGDSLTPAGQRYYRLAYSSPDEAGDRLLWNQEIGLRKNLSISNTVARIDLGYDTHDYIGLGVRGFLQSWALRADVVRDLNDGFGGQLALQTRLGKAAVNLEYRGLSGLRSEIYPDLVDPLRMQTTLRVDGIPVPQTWHLQPASLTATHERREAGDSTTQATLRLSATPKDLWISHYLNWQRWASPGSASTTQTSGNLLISRRYRGLTVRSEVNYDISPLTRLNNVVLDLQSFGRRDYQTNFSLSRSLIGERETIATLAVTYKTGSVYVGPAVSYSDTPSEFSGGLDLASSFQWEPRSGQWLVRPESLATHGNASVRVFLDRNRDGSYNLGDKLLSGVTFDVNGRPQDTATNAQGIALLTGLAVDAPTDLSVAQDSLEEPLWMPIQPGVRFVSRLGNVVQVDFAIEALGEVSGTIFVDRAGKRQELSGVPIELVDAQGKIVVQGRSAYDGFYILSKVPPGSYYLRLDLLETQRLGLAAQSRKVTIPLEGGFVDAVDLLVPLAGATDSKDQTAPSTAREKP